MGLTTSTEVPPFMMKLKLSKWWLLVAINIVLILAGKSTAILLGKFFYDHGGDGIWLPMLLQHVAFPVLLIPYFIIRSYENPSTVSNQPSITKVSLIYFFLGLLVAGVNFLYTLGFVFISAKAYAFMYATQLVFTAIFTFFINSQKFTAYILNAVVSLTISVFLLAHTKTFYKPSAFKNEVDSNVIGILCTLGGSILSALSLSLMQLSFHRILKKTTYSVILEMQIFKSVVAACISIVIVFASGEWSSFGRDMDQFERERISYVLALIWIAIALQVFAVGLVGLIFMVSALFSNVFNIGSLALTGIIVAIIDHDHIGKALVSWRVLIFLLALWGFATYVYQNYLDCIKARKAQNYPSDVPNDSCC